MAVERMNAIESEDGARSVRTLPSRRRRHVLFLIDQLYSIGGGAEGAIEKLCRFLPPDQFRCSVATFWAKPDIQEQFSCPVHVYPLQRIYGWNALKCGLRFRRFLLSEHVDILHTFFPASDIWGSAVAMMSRRPVLISSRRDMGILRLRKHRIPYLFANRLFDQVQAVSEKVREFCIEEEHLAPNKVITVRNGVDLEQIDAAAPSERSAFAVDNDTPAVMTVANLRFIKGIDVLLRAAALVRSEVPGVMFTIVGHWHDERYRQELASLSGHLDLVNNVKFLGAREDVFSLLKGADAFCLPSRSEGMSNALLEAMACSLPCVATNVGGNSEVIVDGENGFLVPSQQPGVMAARLVALLKNAALRNRMGNAGRKSVEEKFTVQHMVNRLASSYTQLLESRESACLESSTESQAAQIHGTLPQ